MPCLLNEDPAPAWGQIQVSNRLCGEWNEKSPEEKDLGELLDGKLNMSWQGALAVQKPTSKSAWPAGRGDSSFLLCFVRTHLGTASSSWVSRWTWICWNGSRERPQKWSETGAHVLWRQDDRWGCLEKSRFREDLVATSQYLKGAYQRDGEGLFTRLLLVVGQGAMDLNWKRIDLG